LFLGQPQIEHGSPLLSAPLSLGGTAEAIPDFRGAGRAAAIEGGGTAGDQSTCATDCGAAATK
jgi:hypothetical protein